MALAVMGPSLDFLLSHGDAVFPDTPIVFCGFDRRELAGRSLPSHVTGVLLKREFTPTLELALGLHPDTRRIVLVGGTSAFDARLVKQARLEYRAYEKRLEFKYLTDLELPQLLGELSRLPPHTVVLYTTLFRDGAGDPFVPHEGDRRTSRYHDAHRGVPQVPDHGEAGGPPPLVRPTCHLTVSAATRGV